MIKTCEELNQARVQAQLEIQSYACRILVCSGTGCIATGSHKIHERFEDLVKETPGIELVFSPCGGHDGETVVGVKKTGCQGFCELGPLVRIQKGDKVIQYVKVQPEDCAEIVEKSVLGDEVIERLLYKKGEKVYVQPDEIPFIAKQTRIVLENCGKFDAESLDEYLASGGFDALLSFIRKVFRGKKGGQLGMGLLVGAMDIATANNTVAIVMANPIAKEMSEDYGISPSRTACLLDTFSCIFQGIIPYGAQMLVAISAAAEMGFALSAFSIMRYLFYPYLLLVSSLVAIFLVKGKKN